MRNIKNYTITTLLVTAFMLSCSKDFIEVKPEGKPLETTYYKNEAHATAALIAVYDVTRKNSGGFENMITMMNAGSDDHYAGGGGATDGAGIQGFSNYTLDPNTMPMSFWKDHYAGIFRANILLVKLPDVDMSDALKTRFAAEAKALRALYYFNLVRMFKNVPLILAPIEPVDWYKIPQASSAEVYTQIENDLLAAIAVLPPTLPNAEIGRVTKGAAQALLGKVYLYEGKNAQAAAVLAEVNGTPGVTTQYGKKLLTNFDDLWVVNNKFNTESVWECAHAGSGSSHWGIWGSGADEGNTVNVMVGPRGYLKVSDAPDLRSGWSFNVFTLDFVNFMTGDPRFNATVFNIQPYESFAQSLIPSKNAYIKGYQDTGYFLNKFLPRASDVSGGTGEPVLNYRQNTYIIRLADTYLMEAEALGATGTRAQALLDAVRSRVGLPSVPVTLAAIKAERRKELAGEGHRFFDLVRWGDAPTVLASRGFVAGKNEIFPIPYKDLENTLIVQNPNY